MQLLKRVLLPFLWGKRTFSVPSSGEDKFVRSLRGLSEDSSVKEANCFSSFRGDGRGVKSVEEETTWSKSTSDIPVSCLMLLLPFPPSKRHGTANSWLSFLKVLLPVCRYDRVNTANFSSVRMRSATPSRSPGTGSLQVMSWKMLTFISVIHLTVNIQFSHEWDCFSPTDGTDGHRFIFSEHEYLHCP